MARRVYFVEGEKDADRAWSIGLPATTCAGGSEAWRGYADDYISQLVAAGCRELVVIPDNDLPGFRFAKAVIADALKSGIKCKLVDLPGVGEKGDLSDWMDAGHTREELLALVEAAPFLTEPPRERIEPDMSPPVETAPQDPAWPDNGTYAVRHGALCRLRTTKEGADWTEPLCNFRARVAEELLLDDGVQQSRALIVEGWMEDGAKLPTIRVPVAKFPSMNWIMDQWGLRPVMKAGQSTKDFVREAMQRLSRPGLRRLYTHTGWRPADGGGWTYLTASGAVGRDGYEVDLGKGLDRYRLPQYPDKVRSGVQASIRLLDLGPLSVTVPLLGSVYRAALGGLLPIDYSLWIEGPTGNYKSTLAALFLGHWGKFQRLSLPESWSSTANALERAAFILKDCWLVIDDYHPTTLEGREQEAKAARLIRSQGNLTGRSRLRQDLGEQPAMVPRGLIVGTGEQHPGGQSLVGRMLVLELEGGRLRLPLLTELQRSAWLLPHALAGYVEWLAPQLDALKDPILELFEQTRSTALELGKKHARIPEVIAHCWIGIKCLADYARAVEAISEEEMEKLLDQSWEALLGVAEGQDAQIEEERPSRRFFQNLQTLLDQKRVILLGKDQAPESIHRTPPDPVGWHDEGFIFLDPAGAYQAICKFSQATGEPFLIRQSRFYANLIKEKISEGADKNHNTAVKKIGGKLRRIILVNKGAVKGLLGVSLNVPKDDGPQLDEIVEKYNADTPF